MDNKYEMFLYWIRERECIRQAKESEKPKPWSHDEVFQKTYFCNVHREDDRVTRWIRSNWPPAYNQPSWRHTVAMAVARFVNKPETLATLSYPQQGMSRGWCDAWSYAMSQPKAWGGAYLVSTNGRAMPKPQYILEHVLLPLEQALEGFSCSTLASTHHYLTGLEGLGSFMSGQIIADCKNSPGHELYTAPDWWTWCAHGPGSLRGMAWVRGMDKCTPTVFYEHIDVLMDQVKEDIPQIKIHAQDLQNCLCEFDKYCRVFYNTGRSKRRYDGA